MTHSPWQTGKPPGDPPPPGPDARIAPELARCEPLYLAMMGTLCMTSRSDPELPSIAAIVTVAELLGDLVVNTGALWVQPDLVAALRDLADKLEARRGGPEKPALATLRDFFLSARPPVAN
jgi:hypothetical protein